MAKKLYFTSLKGGTGVTACCVGLGFALAELGERTLIVDGDDKSGNALLFGGVENMQVYTLADFERGACRAKQALISHPHASNLCFLPSLGVRDRLCADKAVTALDGLFDYILMDKIAQSVCDRAVIVTEPYLPAMKSADVCRATLSDSGIKDISLIVNKMCGGLVLSGETAAADEIAAMLRLPLMAVIPEDLNVSSGEAKKITAKAFRTAAENLTGKREGVFNVVKTYRGIGGYFKRKARERI